MLYVSPNRVGLIWHNLLQTVSQRKGPFQFSALLVVINKAARPIVLYNFGFEQQFPSITNQVAECFDTVLNGKPIDRFQCKHVCFDTFINQASLEPRVSAFALHNSMFRSLAPHPPDSRLNLLLKPFNQFTIGIDKGLFRLNLRHEGGPDVHCPLLAFPLWFFFSMNSTTMLAVLGEAD